MSSNQESCKKKTVGSPNVSSEDIKKFSDHIQKLGKQFLIGEGRNCKKKDASSYVRGEDYTYDT